MFYKLLKLLDEKLSFVTVAAKQEDLYEGLQNTNKSFGG